MEEIKSIIENIDDLVVLIENHNFTEEMANYVLKTVEEEIEESPLLPFFAVLDVSDNSGQSGQ